MPISPIAQSMLPPPPDLGPACADGATASCSGSSRTASNIPACRPGRRSSATTRSGPWSRSCAACPALDAQAIARSRLAGWPDPAAERTRGRDEPKAAPDAVGACARCHGDERMGRPARLVPLLHGQPAELLTGGARSLCAVGAATAASCSRSRSISPRSDEAGRATITPGCRRRPAAEPRATDPAAIERGRALAREGDAGAQDSAMRRLPRRERCRSIRVSPARTPPIWPTGCGFGGRRVRAHRHRRHHGADRAALERRQIDDVSAYFSPSLSRARPRRRRDDAHARTSGAAGRALLGGCAGVQSVLAPRGSRPAVAIWPGCCSRSAPLVLAIVVAASCGSPSAARSRARCCLARRERSSRRGLVFPVVTLTVLLAYGVWRDASRDRAADADRGVRIEVIGEQWWWRVAYAARTPR